MWPRLFVFLLSFTLVSIASIETASAYLAEERMLMKIATTCSVVGSPTSVLSGQSPALTTLSPLALVSKNPGEVLAANAAPASLAQVPYSISSPKMLAIYRPGADFEVMEPEALRALETMLDQANQDLTRGAYDRASREISKLYVHSAYRAYDVQCRLFKKKVRRELELHPELRTELDAVASVNSRSALPGQSEHQLGTAVDLVYMIPGLGYELEPEMDQTPGFAWLSANAFRYGFAMSYPRTAGDVRSPNARTGYVYEPWHWRYIGIAHATAFAMCAQRGVTLQEYLRTIKQNPYATCR